MQELWASHPEYRPDEDAWRYEVQYRREKLRAVGIISVEEAFRNLELFLCWGLLWVQPREATESNLSRCEVQEWWLELRGTFPSEQLPKLKEAKRRAGFAQLTPQMLGSLVTCAANAGSYTLEGALSLQARAFRSYIDESGKSFETRVRERERLLAH